MTDPHDIAAADVAVCPCGPPPFPWVIFNPPNQPTIACRIGDYDAFRRALLQALPGETELSRVADGGLVEIWRPGGAGDLAVQMMEWWAYLGDILTFYNERIATQAYLGVADLPESVNRLVQLLGYRPRPGIGATGIVAALLSGGKPVTLPAGFQVQSKPGPGQQPQVFELTAAVTAREPDRIASRPVPAASPLLSADRATVWLAGRIGGIKPGDRLLLANLAEVSAFAWITVKSVEPQTDPYGNPVTAVSFTAAVQNLPADAAAGDFALMRSTRSAALWAIKPAGWNTPVISSGGIDLASVARDLAPGAPVLLEVVGTPSDAAVETTLVTASAYSETVWFANGNGTMAPNGASAPIPILHTHIDFSPSISGDWDGNAGLVNVRFGWSSVGRLAPVLSSAEASLSGAPATLVTAGRFPAGIDTPLLLEDGQGEGAAAIGTAAADASTMTIGSLTATSAERLGPSIDVLFNLLTVSRGQTVANEVLGSGNAAVAGQEFTLRKSPVTYFTDPGSRSGDGFSSTVQVWVNQIRWDEVPSFFGQAADATVFVTREDEQAKTQILFGDGINGARLPSGVDNVVAVYRFGSGAEAPAPGTLTNIMRPLPGLRALRNPIAPTGGADPDPPAKVRTLAPRSVLTFRRAVSLDDYQVIAAMTPGVVRAAAAYRFDPLAQRPGVTIWVSGDAGAVAAVQAALAGQADPNRHVTVLPAAPIDTWISLTYVRDPRYRDEVVAAALHAALLDPDLGLFGINRVGIGEAVYDSQIYEACLAAAGVAAVEDLEVRIGSRFARLTALRRVRRGRVPIGRVRPCTGHRHDPGPGNYLRVADDVAHLRLTGRPAS
ncbi:MAG TPA: hypothetical protein VFX06_09350 [Stellaceae bacterium]|nr:hypothetical protein [Stellaceae bacterium]